MLVERFVVIFKASRFARIRFIFSIGLVLSLAFGAAMEQVLIESRVALPAFVSGYAAGRPGDVGIPIDFYIESNTAIEAFAMAFMYDGSVLRCESVVPRIKVFGEEPDFLVADLWGSEEPGSTHGVYVVMVVDVEVDPVGMLLPRDGATYHKAKAKLLCFSPRPQEVGEGEVVEITEFGAFIRVGPLDALLHISQILSLIHI